MLAGGVEALVAFFNHPLSVPIEGKVQQCEVGRAGVHLVVRVKTAFSAPKGSQIDFCDASASNHIA